MCWGKMYMAKELICPDSAFCWKGLGCCLQDVEGRGLEVSCWYLLSSPLELSA